MSDKPKNEPEETKELEVGEKETEGVPHFVTPLRPIVHQVGEHVLAALEEEETVAVLTTITGSNQGQQVISIPLTAEHVQQVRGLIEEIHESDEPERVPCVGFHCLLEDEAANEETKE
jgi:hypothetical protein